MSKIKDIRARQIIDSRGNPTVEVDILTENGHLGRAAVPSGASTGIREALELRDGGDLFCGKSVFKAIENIHKIIRPNLLGLDVGSQEEIDQRMIDLDGTDSKSSLGANGILGVSLSVARACALEKGVPLFRYLNENFFKGISMGFPSPLVNIINGGAHASNDLDIQEFMIVPQVEGNFGKNLQASVEIFHHLKSVLKKRGLSTNVGDEGGFAPDLSSHEQALDLISEAVGQANYRLGEDVFLAIDAAASEFYKDGQYAMQGKNYSGEELIEYYFNLISDYPIISIEDGPSEDDFGVWKQLTQKVGEKTLLVGDDLFVTNPEILSRGIAEGLGNSILIKVNQIGTLSETVETIHLAHKNNYRVIVSHRSGETADSFIADLAVASGAQGIKTGAVSRTDRTEKYNQLLRIEEYFKNEGLQAPFTRLK